MWVVAWVVEKVQSCYGAFLVPTLSTLIHVVKTGCFGISILCKKDIQSDKKDQNCNVVIYRNMTSSRNQYT